MKPKKPMRSRPAKGKGGGFDSLDPSKMGFAMPDWMEAPTQPGEPEGTLPKGPLSAEPEMRSPENRSVVEGMKVVCICKGIKKRVFWKALDAGICTHEDINRHTGSGSGSCQGRRCGPRILDMLKRLSR